LHYVDDWKGLLDRFALLQPAYILFADLPAADNQSFVTTQMYYGQRIPVHFWNLDEFVSCIRDRGYELVLRSRYRGYYIERDADLPTAHFDPDHRLAYVVQLIFRRITNP
jgi:putative methyltransferase (TIGR04325 family)